MLAPLPVRFKTSCGSIAAAFLAQAIAAVLLVSSCVKLQEDGTREEPASEAVAFDAYLTRGVTTKAGATGTLIKAGLRSEGFGVFAYHTVNGSYSEAALPNFMYNMQVTSAGGSAWDYAPVKYWPNQKGEGTTVVDKLSFFAYAPYVAVDPLTGELSDPDDGTPATSWTGGITGLTRSTDTGDPSVNYRVSFVPGNSVDLCWSPPVTNVTQPDVASKIQLTFHHATSALNVQVDALTDEILPPAANERDSGTRIYPRSITFEGFSGKGTLNLNSPTAPLWGGYAPDVSLSRLPLTVYDGRLDGLEALYDDLLETPCGLNPDLVQAGTYNAKPGAVGTRVNLFDSEDVNAPVYVIPNGYPLKVRIVYDVETVDPKLTGSYLGDGTTHGCSTRVDLSCGFTSATGPIRLESGKRYVLRLHLGVTSVKFSAEILVKDNWNEDIVTTTGQMVLVHDLENEWPTWTTL